MMTIINDTADKMTNATREIGQKRVDNLKILPSACNWDYIRVASNHLSLLAFSIVVALNSLIFRLRSSKVSTGGQYLQSLYPMFPVLPSMLIPIKLTQRWI
jgi:hypothetical protein